MRTCAGNLVLVLFMLWSVPTYATVLTDDTSFHNPTVISDFSGLGGHQGEAGPVFFKGLQIESLNNSPMYQEIRELGYGPGVFPGDGSSIVTVLTANVTLTDFRLTFPAVVARAGFYIHSAGSYDIEALDSNQNVLESTPLDMRILDYPRVAFRGFADLPDLRAIRIKELFDDYESTQFDFVQWEVATAEPSTLVLVGVAAIALLTVRSRQFLLTLSPPLSPSQTHPPAGPARLGAELGPQKAVPWGGSFFAPPRPSATLSDGGPGTTWGNME